MDQRTTIESNQSFLQLLQDIMDEDKKANIIFDCMGMERAEGKIAKIVVNESPAYIMLEDNSQKIFIDEIIGVNGLFRGDFSEC